MYTVILGPREHHNVASVKAYRHAHATSIARKRRAGWRIQVHDSPEEKAARIDFGNWIIDCECGAGNSVDPEWGVALCFGCGAVHEHITFPTTEARLEIEQLLLERPETSARGWNKDESVEQLRVENADLRKETDERLDEKSADAAAEKADPRMK